MSLGFDSCLKLLEKVTVNADSSIFRANVCALFYTLFLCEELKKSTRKFKINTPLYNDLYILADEKGKKMLRGLELPSY